VSELDWTEKYRPKRLSDVLGNDKAISELRKWAESWKKDKPIKKGVILADNSAGGNHRCNESNIFYGRRISPEYKRRS
jgi:replication factor C large subunit